MFGFRAALAATARGDVVDACGGAEEFERVRWCENAHIETRAAAHDHAERAELNGLAECVIALQSHRNRSSSLSATPCGTPDKWQSTVVQRLSPVEGGHNLFLVGDTHTRFANVEHHIRRTRAEFVV